MVAGRPEVVVPGVEAVGAAGREEGKLGEGAREEGEVEVEAKEVGSLEAVAWAEAG